MNIKTVLYIAILSIVEHHKDVQCKKLLETYLSYDANDFESFNLTCHAALYSYIAKQLYLPSSIVTNGYFIFQAIHYDGKKNLMKLDVNIWIFFYKCKDWVNNDQVDILDLAKQMIIDGISNGLWENQSEELTEPSRFMELDLMELFLKQRIWNLNKTSDELTQLPVPIEYGNILLLIKKEEWIDFYHFGNEFCQKIFVIDIMKEALINMFDAINSIFRKIQLDKITVEEVKHVPDVEEASIVKLKIIKYLYEKVINTTEAVFDIQEDRSGYSRINQCIQDDISSSSMKPQQNQDTHSNIRIIRSQLQAKRQKLDRYSPNTGQPEPKYPDLVEEYIYYMDIFKAKLNNICPDAVIEKHKRTNMYIYTKLKNNFSGRLTILNNDGNYSVRVPMFQYYPNTPYYVYNEPLMERLVKEDGEINLLLEFNGWTTIIQTFSDLMKNDKSINHVDGSSNKSIKNIFSEDRELLRN